MRGIPNADIWWALALGFTPAYAGNTQRKPAVIRLIWVHPRVCGEHVDLAGVV